MVENLLSACADRHLLRFTIARLPNCARAVGGTAPDDYDAIISVFISRAASAAGVVARGPARRGRPPGRTRTGTGAGRPGTAGGPARLGRRPALSRPAGTLPGGRPPRRPAGRPSTPAPPSRSPPRIRNTRPARAAR